MEDAQNGGDQRSFTPYDRPFLGVNSTVPAFSDGNSMLRDTAFWAHFWKGNTGVF